MLGRGGAMSERAIRGVVASVLVGALVLAIIVASAIFLARSTEPAPDASVAYSPALGPTRSLAPTPIPLPAFGVPVVTGVGRIRRVCSSGKTLVLQFLESSVDAIL